MSSISIWEGRLLMLDEGGRVRQRYDVERTVPCPPGTALFSDCSYSDARGYLAGRRQNNSLQINQSSTSRTSSPDDRGRVQRGSLEGWNPID